MLVVIDAEWNIADIFFYLQVFMMNLSAPFICEFFKDVQEKAFP